ncbi:MAG: hypothetical protein V1709_00160, partial [Planctomycetota bacterium]
PNGNFNICDTPGPDWIKESLVLSFGCYIRMVDLINKVFALKLDNNLKEIDTEAASLVKEL